MEHKVCWTKVPISKTRYVKVGRIRPGIMHEDDFVSRIAVKFVRWSPTLSRVVINDFAFSLEAFNAMQIATQKVLS